MILNKEGILRVTGQGKLTIIGEEIHRRALRQYKMSSVSEDWVKKKRQAERRQENSLLVERKDDASLCVFMESQRAGYVRVGAMLSEPMQQRCVGAGGTAAGGYKD